MTKKFVIIAGIIAIAAAAAGLVAYFLTRNKQISQILEDDDEMCLDFDEENLAI